MKDEAGEDRKTPLARWAAIVPPASLTTTTGAQRFVVTVKLAEKSPKTASTFVKEMNDALRTKVDKPHPQFVLLDSERTRSQRASASFSTFKAALACLNFLKDLGLPTNEISAELEDFGYKKYDPWYERNSQAWWPWLAAWRDPPPEMPMMKVKSRLDVSEGGKYKAGAGGKLGKSDDVDRADARGDEDESGGKKRNKDKPRGDDDQDEAKPRRKKKRRDEGE